jgi:GNAT superfamily N-acetyltransferase
MGTLTIRPVSYSDVLDDPRAVSLLSGYADECAIPLIGQPTPSAPMYAALESSHALQCFGAYDGDDLIGFASVLTTIYPHYSKKVATIESLYVGKNQRGSGAGRALMQAVENYAADHECVAILYSAPACGDFSQLLARDSHYKRTNSVYCRSLA